MWEPRRLTFLRASTACYRDSFSSFLAFLPVTSKYWYLWYLFSKKLLRTLRRRLCIQLNIRLSVITLWACWIYTAIWTFCRILFRVYKTIRSLWFRCPRWRHSLGPHVWICLGKWMKFCPYSSALTHVMVQALVSCFPAKRVQLCLHVICFRSLILSPNRLKWLAHERRRWIRNWRLDKGKESSSSESIFLDCYQLRVKLPQAPWTHLVCPLNFDQNPGINKVLSPHCNDDCWNTFITNALFIISRGSTLIHWTTK
jgi:hypothetical protein